MIILSFIWFVITRHLVSFILTVTVLGWTSVKLLPPCCLDDILTFNVLLERVVDNPLMVSEYMVDQADIK